MKRINWKKTSISFLAAVFMAMTAVSTFAADASRAQSTKGKRLSTKLEAGDVITLKCTRCKSETPVMVVKKDKKGKIKPATNTKNRGLSLKYVCPSCAAK